MDDEEMDLEEVQKKHGKKGKLGFSTQQILLVFLFVFGFIAGMFVQHQFVEPFLTGSTQLLNDCMASKRLLNEELTQCYTALNSARESNEDAPPV